MARIPGQRLKRVLWLISTVEKPRSTAWRRRVAPSVVRSACQQVERAREVGDMKVSFAKRGVGAKGFFWEGADGEGGEGVILDIYLLIFN